MPVSKHRRKGKKPGVAGKKKQAQLKAVNDMLQQAREKRTPQSMADMLVWAGFGR